MKAGGVSVCVAWWRCWWNPLEGEIREAGSRCRFHWLGGTPKVGPGRGSAGKEAPCGSASLRPPGPGDSGEGSPPRKPVLDDRLPSSLPFAWGGGVVGADPPPALDWGCPARGPPGGGAEVHPDVAGALGSAHRSAGHFVRGGHGRGQASVPHPPGRRQSPLTSSGRLALDGEDPLVLRTM